VHRRISYIDHWRAPQTDEISPGALAEGVVGLDQLGQLALRVDGEGQGDAVALRRTSQ
jgi:hypothetical protein